MQAVQSAGIDCCHHTNSITADFGYWNKGFGFKNEAFGYKDTGSVPRNGYGLWQNKKGTS